VSGNFGRRYFFEKDTAYLRFLMFLYSGTNTIIADATIEKITVKSISLLYASNR
jgi:hypothetical protein